MNMSGLCSVLVVYVVISHTVESRVIQGSSHPEWILPVKMTNTRQEYSQNTPSQHEEASEETGKYTVLIVVIVLTSVYPPHSLMFVVCSIVIWCLCRARTTRSDTAVSFTPTSHTEIKLKVTKFTPQIKGYSSTSCAICLSEYPPPSFEPEQEVTLTACSHVYHPYCLQQWIETRQTRCPICGNEGLESNIIRSDISQLRLAV